MQDSDVLEKPTLNHPLTVAFDYIEMSGYEMIASTEGAEVIGFGIPNHLGGASEAVVEYLDGTNLLQVTVSLTEGEVRPELRNGLHRLLNELNILFPGVTCSFDDDETYGDEIEISISCFVFEEQEVQRHLGLMINYLEEVLKLTLPAIYEYVAQKLIFNITTRGDIVAVRPTWFVSDCLARIEGDNVGHA